MVSITRKKTSTCSKESETDALFKSDHMCVVKGDQVQSFKQCKRKILRNKRFTETCSGIPSGAAEPADPKTTAKRDGTAALAVNTVFPA